MRILFAYDGPWCFVLKMDASGEQGHVKAVPESLADVMRARGWHVMGTDAEPEIEPAQSNPNRGTR